MSGKHKEWMEKSLFMHPGKLSLVSITFNLAVLSVLEFQTFYTITRYGDSVFISFKIFMYFVFRTVAWISLVPDTQKCLCLLFLLTKCTLDGCVYICCTFVCKGRKQNAQS